MNAKTILLTGITGFIGRNLARELQQHYQLTALIRPKTAKQRYEEFQNQVQIVELDLADTNQLQNFLCHHHYDFIIHIGALRGGRKFNQTEYIKVNVQSTKLFIDNALENQAKFIFCSTVGVLGAIPHKLPATIHSPYKHDNCYHSTKIKCEEMIMQNIAEKSLQACIIRPSITYGQDDFGFPYTLTKLVTKKWLFLPPRDIHIHLTNVSTLVKVFSQLLEDKFVSGKIWIVADYEKINLSLLVNHIYRVMKVQNFSISTISQDPSRTIPFTLPSIKYPSNRVLPLCFFHLLIKLAILLKLDLWVARLQLISQSWYYDVHDTYQHFQIEPSTTIPAFNSVIQWYQELNDKRYRNPKMVSRN